VDSVKKAAITTAYILGQLGKLVSLTNECPNHLSFLSRIRQVRKFKLYGTVLDINLYASGRFLFLIHFSSH